MARDEQGVDLVKPSDTGLTLGDPLRTSAAALGGWLGPRTAPRVGDRTANARTAPQR